MRVAETRTQSSPIAVSSAADWAVVVVVAVAAGTGPPRLSSLHH